MRGQHATCVAEFTVGEGERAGFRLGWRAPRQPDPEPFDVTGGPRNTENWWRKWGRTCSYDGEHRDAGVRSLNALEALTCAPNDGGRTSACDSAMPRVFNSDAARLAVPADTV